MRRRRLKKLERKILKRLNKFKVESEELTLLYITYRKIFSHSVLCYTSSACANRKEIIFKLFSSKADEFPKQIKTTIGHLRKFRRGRVWLGAYLVPCLYHCGAIQHFYASLFFIFPFYFSHSFPLFYFPLFIWLVLWRFLLSWSVRLEVKVLPHPKEIYRLFLITIKLHLSMNGHWAPCCSCILFH